MAASAASAAAPGLGQMDADNADGGLKLTPEEEAQTHEVQLEDPTPASPDLPHGKRHDDFVREGIKRSSLLNERKTRAIRMASDLWRLTGCSVLLIVVTQDLHATFYTTHGNAVTWLERLAGLSDWKASNRGRHSVAIDFPGLLGGYEAAKAGALRYTKTLLHALNGLVGFDYGWNADQYTDTLSETARHETGDILKRQLETLLAAYAAPESEAAKALARAVERAGVELLDGGGATTGSQGTQTEAVGPAHEPEGAMAMED